MARKKNVPDQPRQVVVQIVSGQGTDQEIAARCADRVPGWESLGDAGKADLVRLMRWYEEQTVAPAMVADKQGPLQGVIRQPDGANSTLFYLRLIELFGTGSPELLDQRISDLARYAKLTGDSDPGRVVSSMLGFIKGVKAEDPAQATLATQMAATHDAAMYALGQMRGAQFAEQAKMFGTISAKLLNAYTRQAEVLTKMQRGGEQVVRHVHTYIDNRNGQAIIAENVTTGGQGAISKSGYQGDETTGAEAIGLCASMPGAQPFGQSVPVSSGEGQEALPHARRGSRIRRAQGQ
jgi:hypothetical protein